MDNREYMRRYMKEYRKKESYKRYQREYQRGYVRENAELEEIKAALRTLQDDGAITLKRGVSRHSDKAIAILMGAMA